MIKVLVAENIRLLREALVTLLRLEGDIDVVAAVGTGDAIIPAAIRLRPDVAIIEITVPDHDGLDAVVELRRRLPACRVLILAGSCQPAVLRRSIQAQVNGFMLKDAGPHELVHAIRTLAGGGGKVIDPELAYKAIDHPDGPLTDREVTVLRLTAAGSPPREVASQLHLSYGTVRNYLASTVAKLGARNRVDAIRIATDSGWI